MDKLKRIILLMLCAAITLSLLSCTKKSDIGVKPDDREDEQELEENESRYNFLVLGHDRAASLTDVMMIVSFDIDKKEMALVQIPRDTYFETGDYYYHKINGLYNYFIEEAKEEGSSDSELDGCIKTAEYLSENLDIKIHYSAVMDLDGFAAIVDAIGGVYMYVPYSMHYPDPAQNLYIDLQEGYQTLDGDAAEQFVRFRSGYLEADLARQDAQKMFMTAFVENVKKNITLANIDDVASAVLESVKTDMGLTDVIKFGKALLSTDLSGITMMSLPGEATYCDGAWYFVMNRAAVADIMNRHFNLYEKPVTDTSFDKARAFCNENDPDMYEVYTQLKEEYAVTEHNAQDVSDKDIDIALK